MNLKKMVFRLLSITIVFSMMCAISAFAETSRISVSPKTVEDLKTVSPEEVPEGIVPMEFDSEESAVAYLNHIYSNMTLITGEDIPATYATNGNATVAEQRLGVLGGKVILKLRYTTSGNGNTGTITMLDPYTTTSGITYSFDWREDSIGAEIASSGKDVYAYSDGVIIAYLLVDGLIKLDETPVSLNGFVALIR